RRMRIRPPRPATGQLLKRASKMLMRGEFIRPRCDSRRIPTQDQGGRMLHLIWWILVGLIAGWATGKIMKGSGYGTLGDIVLGIVGAIVGGWIMGLLGFSGQGGTIYTILVAILGAVILVWLIRKIKGR